MPQVKKANAVSLNGKYDGEPKFEPIEDTSRRFWWRVSALMMDCLRVLEGTGGSEEQFEKNAPRLVWIQPRA